MPADRIVRLGERIERALGVGMLRSAALGGGCVADVRRVWLADGRCCVAKLDRRASAGLLDEAFMLAELADRLPVPRVWHAESDLLLMQWMEGTTGASGAAEEHAARLLAALHSTGPPADGFGLHRDTRIGGLRQPNDRSASWCEFFAERRLRFMANEAREAGRLPAAMVQRVESLAGRLERWIDDAPTPSLVHGDVWSGNVLSRGGRVTAFLDPAIYYADAEVELAFVTLFHTFGERFFAAYRECRPIAPEFERRWQLYNLYPLLVHVRLFGGSYVGSVDSTLRTFGC